jgi:hypothetical protein
MGDRGREHRRMSISRLRLPIAIAVAACALSALAPASIAEPPVPAPGHYRAHLTVRHPHLFGTIVSWRVRGVSDDHPVDLVRECPDSGPCDKGSGYLWEDSSTLEWHVRLKFSKDFQLDGTWDRHGGGRMCFLRHNSERQDTSHNCAPHAFGFSKTDD